MSDPVRILIVDDHGIFRDAMAHMFSTEPGFTVVGYHATVAEAIRTLSAEPVDVVLLDYELRTERGSASINWAAGEGFRGHFLIVTAGLTQSDATWLIQHQVAGIFLKENSFSELLIAVGAVAQGGKWLDQPFLKLVMETLADDAARKVTRLFTEREQVVLRFLVEGCTNKDIGERLKVSEPAVKATVQRLFDKIGVRSRGHLIRIAIQKYQNYF